MDAGTIVVRLIADSTAFMAGMGKASTGAAAFGTQMTRMGKGMSTYVTLPVVAAGVAAVKLSLDFQKSMTDVEALVGMGADEVARFKGEILALAPAVGKAPKELGDAFYFIASSGLKGAAAMRALTASAKASAAGLGDTKTIADAVTSAINAYGEGMLSASRATDILLAAVREGKSDPEEFAGSIGRVIPIAAKMGVTFGEVSGIMAAMSLNGTDANEAVTQISAMLAASIKPTKDGAAALKAIHMSYADLRKEIAQNGLTDTVSRLDKAFNGNIETLGKLFPNLRALRGFLALTGAEADKYAGIIDRVSAAQGDVNRAFEIAASKPGFKLAQAWSELKVALIEVGDVIVPVVADIAASVAKLTKSFNGLSASTKEGVVKFALVVAAIGPVMLVVGKAAALFGTLSGAIAAAAPMVTALGSAFAVGGLAALGTSIAAALGPVGLAIAGIVALGAALVVAYKKSETFRNVVSSAFSAAGAVVGAVVSTFSTALSRWGTVLAAVWGQVSAGVRYLATTLGPPLASLSDAISGRLGGAFDIALIYARRFWDTLSAFGSAIQGLWAPVWAQIGDTVRVAFAIAQDYARIGVQALGGIIRGLAVGINSGDWKAAWAKMKTAVHDALASIGIETKFAQATLGPMMHELGKKMADAYEKTKPLLQAAGKFVLRELWEVVKWAAPKVYDAIRAVARGLGEKFRQHAPGLLKAAGKFAMQVLWDVIKSVASSIVRWMASLPGKIAAGLKSLAGSLKTKGSAGMAGLLNGLRNKWGDVKSFVADVPGKIKDYFSDAASWLLSAGSAIFDGLISGMTEAGARAAEIARGIAGDIKDAVTGFMGIHSPSTVMMSVGKDIALGLAHGLKKGQKEAVAAAAEMASNIASVLESALGIGDSIAALKSGGMPGVVVATKYAKKVAHLIHAMSDAMKAELGKIDLGKKDATKNRFASASEMAGSMASIFSAFVELSPESVAKAIAGIAAAKTQARTIAKAVASMVKDFRKELGKLVISEGESSTSDRALGLAGGIAGLLGSFVEITAKSVDAAVAGIEAARGKVPQLAAAVIAMVADFRAVMALTITEVESGAADRATGAAGNVATILGNFAEFTISSIDKAIAGLKYAATKAPDLAAAMVKMVGALQAGLVGVTADENFVALTSNVASITGSVTGVLRDLAEMTIKAVDNGIGGARTVANRAATLGVALKAMVSAISTAIGGIDTAGLAALQASLTVLADISSKIAAIVNDLAGMTTEQLTAATAAGASLGEGFYEGLLSWHDRIIALAGDIAADTAAALAGGATLAPAVSGASYGAAAGTPPGGGMVSNDKYSVSVSVGNVQATSPEQAQALSDNIANTVITKLAAATAGTRRNKGG